jgi:peptidoglycan/xylan/chitin deacetylase (PgdA/CDA1 family)
MTIRRKLACVISNLSAVASRFGSERIGLRILMYHSIGNQALGDSRGLFSVSPKNFKAQAALIAEFYRDQVIELKESAISDHGHRLAITFDDGYRDNFEVAAPILNDFSLPFTVFVTSEFIRNKSAGFLSIAGLRDLATLPMVRIGAHGKNHVSLTGCDDGALQSELVSSKEFLEDTIGKEVSAIAYPYGAVDNRVKTAAKAAGYQLGVCSFAGVNRSERDPLLLSRTEILSLDDNRIFSQKLKGNWDWYRWIKIDPESV